MWATVQERFFVKRLTQLLRYIIVFPVNQALCFVPDRVRLVALIAQLPDVRPCQVA